MGSFRYKILKSLDEAAKICAKLRKNGKSTVLAGGVFDILHYGHLKFLKAAKQKGDILIVALESNSNVRRKKGKGRPIHPEKIRAEILKELECVDLVLILPEMKTDKDYFDLVDKLRPDIIAVSQNDPQLENKQKQAKSVGSKVAEVTPQIPTPSTTRLAKILAIE